jgi:hypothetical protein
LDYLKTNREDFNQMTSLFSENLNEIELLFISYLSDDCQTIGTINYLLSRDEFSHQSLSTTILPNNICYCLMKGDAVDDNKTIQSAYQTFLYRICEKNKNLRLQHDAVHLESTSPNVNCVYCCSENLGSSLSLNDILQLTIGKYFVYLKDPHKVAASFNDIVTKINLYLKSIIQILTKDDYRHCSVWPIPELYKNGKRTNRLSDGGEWSSRFLTGENDSKMNLTLKYWNTSEMFDDVLRDQLFNLIKFDNCDEIVHLDNDNVDEKTIEKFIFTYLDRFLSEKEQKDLIADQSMCVQSIYQLKSSIIITIKNQKSSSSMINWSTILSLTFQYLILNGNLLFKNKLIFLDQFLIFCNVNDLKEAELNQQLIITNKDDSPISNSSKRMFNGQSSFKQRRIDQINNKNSTLMNSLLVNDSPPKLQEQIEVDNSIILPLIQQTKQESPKDDRFSQFLQQLNREKENYKQFNRRLTEATSIQSITITKEDQNQINEKEEFNIERNNPMNQLLFKINEEKIKNEKFNSKINNYCVSNVHEII